MLAVRIFFARLPDRLGSIRGASLALSLQAVSLIAMCALHSAPGLYASTFVYSMGASLLYPALFPLVVDGARSTSAGQAIATFTLFFDVSQGLGGSCSASSSRCRVSVGRSAQRDCSRSWGSCCCARQPAAHTWLSACRPRSLVIERHAL